MNWFKLKKKNNKVEHNEQDNNLNKDYELNNLKKEIKENISKLKYDSNGIFLPNIVNGAVNPYIEINKLYLFATLSKAFIINDAHTNYKYDTSYKYGELFYKFDNDDLCKSAIKKFNKEDLYVPDLKGVRIYNYDDFVRIIIDRASKQYKDINVFTNNIFSKYNDEEYLKQVLLKAKANLKIISKICDQMMNIYTILKGCNNKFRSIYYENNKDEINSLVASLYKANDKLFNLIEKYNINFIELKEVKKNKQKEDLYNKKLDYLKDNALNNKKINDISRLVDQL